MSASELLNENEAAAFLHIKPSTIRKWRGVGRISFVKLGACVRYRQSDLRTFIAASVRTATPQAAIDSEIERREAPLSETEAVLQ